MASTEFEKAYKHIRKQEGGYSNHPNDAGGPTIYGITLNRYAEYKGRNVSVDELKKIPEADVQAVYEQEWNSIGGDQISDKRISYLLFDQKVNKGPRAVKHMQKLLGVDADGIVGTDTISTINAKSFDETTELATGFVDYEFNDYKKLAERDPSQAVFLQGWQKRLNNAASFAGVTPSETPMDRLEPNENLSSGHKSYFWSRGSEPVIEEGLDNITVIANGQFRFNDILLDIPPESISILTDEYEDSIHLMRQETPVNKQSGKKRIRVIVNFPVDITHGYDQLSRMIIQIKKTPIATVENEKIRKELYGDILDFANMGFVVDNLSGYVEEDYPNLIRCTLQMSWFNHVPYVDDIKYIEYKNGRKSVQKAPSSEFKRFYLNNTSNDSKVLINNPAPLKDQDSLVIMYKEYQRFGGTISASRPSTGSRLESSPRSMTDANYREIQRLKTEGWYIAEENKDKWDDVIDGVFYRWRRFEIPFNDLTTTGALILQNVSFSLSTNPTYINMEHYSVPTIQFLGGSVADLRAICFAAPQYRSEVDKTPVGTSHILSEIQTIFKKISQDRITYSKYAKENHLLISHPIAKLLKYRPTSKDLLDYNFIDDNGNKRTFKIDNFLPVIVSTAASQTIEGLPYASKYQIDFKETRLARAEHPVKFLESNGSSNGYKIQQNIIKTLFSNNALAYDPKTFSFSIPSVINSRGSAEFTFAESLANALTQLARIDEKVVDIDTAYKSRFFFNIPSRVNQEATFSASWVEQFILNFYVSFCNGVGNGDRWTEAYLEPFKNYSTDFQPQGAKDLYPDMLLPESEVSPAFYFADNSARVDNYRKTIMANMPRVYSETADRIAKKLLDPKFVSNPKKDDSDFGGLGDASLMPGQSRYAPAKNYATYVENRDTGVARIHDINDVNYRVMATQQAIADASAPMHSLKQVYPTFQIQLYNEKYSFFQKFSSTDLSNEEVFEKNQKDLLDIYDLSSIIDIRIIKDEYEAADLMIIRVLATNRSLMTNQAKDPFYNPDTFSVSQLIGDIIAGKSGIGSTYNSNLEDIGLKEGVRIKALLGNSNDHRDLGVEFTGRIAAINGKDVVEIYCLGDGHELIQNTLGYDKSVAEKFSFNSDTTDLIAQLLATAEEVKSFGNTQFEVMKGVGFNAPMLMGGRSALDNIYAPSIHPTGGDGADFIGGTVDTALSTLTTIGGIAIPLAIVGTIAASALIPLGIIGAVGGLALGAITESYKYVTKKLFPAPFVIFQQTIWDVLQELTLRHPGYVCAVVPFDNRSSLYFGEPDGIFFYRGAQSALEKAVKIKAGKETQIISDNATLREILDEKSQFADLKLIADIGDPTAPFSKADAKARIENRTERLQKALSSANLEMLALMAMQKSFRSYHLVTSEHDIVSNDIETSSVGVANSVQVYHPSKAKEANFDGTQYIEDYKLTDKMKADDDLYSNLINNKVFTFHNAHEDFEGLELPQRYAKAILCKELENIYRGKITILGRKGIKPHDIVILRDTHNKINGPVGVRRIVQTISPTNGWLTSIYPKFIAIPDTSAGAFQMKAVLKAARYWLADEAELFYSSMDKFIPNEGTGKGKRDSDFEQSINGLSKDIGSIAEGLNPAITNFQEFMTGEDAAFKMNGGQIQKDILNREGAYSLLGPGGGNATSAATVVGGQILGAKVIAPTLTNRVGDAKDIANLAKNGFKSTASLVGQKQFTQAAVKGSVNLFNVGVKTAVTGTKVVGGVFGGLLLGFGLDYLIESATDGFINYMKYRQPISIFPLSKDGRPWMAALNGFKENTPLEHLALSGVKAADKLAMASHLVQRFLGEWAGEQIGTGNSEEVEIARIVDGDTIEGEGGIPSSLLKLISGSGETFRLIGIDTGEKTAPPGSAEKFMADVAKEYLEKRIKENGGIVSVQRYEQDRYGRTLARIKTGGVDLAQELVDNKMAFFYKGQPKKTTEEDWAKLKAEYEARR